MGELAIYKSLNTLSYAGGLSALAGVIGVLALLRMYRGWVPTGPVGPPIEGSSPEEAGDVGGVGL